MNTPMLPVAFTAGVLGGALGVCDGVTLGDGEVGPLPGAAGVGVIVTTGFGVNAVPPVPQAARPAARPTPRVTAAALPHRRTPARGTRRPS
ncbi:MAG: hypothetical protein LCH87_07630 [Actinobacteria bacterium]|nr:hypothetical protein [Actinomycetota bacterium]